MKIIRCKSFKEIILACLTTSFCANLCIYSGNPHVGYTLVSQRRPIQLYGTCNLSLQGINPKWMVCYDLITNEQGKFFCKVAHSVEFEFLKGTVDNYVMKKYDILAMEHLNPFYKELHFDLPTSVLQVVKADFRRRQHDSSLRFMVEANVNFVDEINRATFYVLSMNELNSNQNMSNLKGHEKVISDYISKLNKNMCETFKHNYIGNIFVFLKDGFAVDTIEFKNTDILIEISDLTVS